VISALLLLDRDIYYAQSMLMMPGWLCLCVSGMIDSLAERWSRAGNPTPLTNLPRTLHGCRLRRVPAKSNCVDVSQLQVADTDSCGVRQRDGSGEEDASKGHRVRQTACEVWCRTTDDARGGRKI